MRMRLHGTTRRAFVPAGALLLLTAPALAGESLSDSIEQFLSDAQKRVDETRVWKFHVEPFLKQSVIYTDNVYLNDDNENNVTLTRVDGPGPITITDPDALARIAANTPEFANTESLGRLDDFILQTEFGGDLVLPVNDEYYNAFQRHAMTLLGGKVRVQEYLDRNELDNTSIFLHTDLFGFLNDILNREWGRSFWVRVKDDYSKLKDPLDTEIRLLGQTGIETVANFHDFGREENTFNFDTGWTGAKVDASVGYENYHLWLDDHELDQAQHTRHNLHGEIGSRVPGWEQQRAYLRYDLWEYRFDEAPVVGLDGTVSDQQVLNDATVQQTMLGVQGPMVSERTMIRAEAGYASWNPDTNGLAADDTAYHGFMGRFQAVYKPWEDRDSRVSLEYYKSIDYSAISNYNLSHNALLQILHEFVPKRWVGDVSVAFTTTSPSDGPDRKLFEAGAGVTYHVFPQMDLTLRYVFRHQTAKNEIVTNSAFARGGRVYEYSIVSDSAFVQNIVELGVLFQF
jgi:hypothetical protein